MGNSNLESAQSWLDPDEWYKDPELQAQETKDDAGRTVEQSTLIGQGFGALGNVLLEDPNDRAIREGLIDDDPFRKTDSSNSGIAGGIVGGLMNIFSPIATGVGAANRDPSVSKWWNATADWFKGAGSKAEMSYYWNGTVPEGYEEDAEGQLVKKKTPVQLQGYGASGKTGSGMS